MSKTKTKVEYVLQWWDKPCKRWCDSDKSPEIEGVRNTRERINTPGHKYQILLRTTIDKFIE